MRQSHAVVIERPVDEVFAYAEDEDNAPKWAEGVVRFEMVREVPGEPGTTYRMIIREGRAENVYEGEVLVWDENERTVNRLKSPGSPMTMTMERRYENIDGRTRLTMSVDVELRGAIKLMAPMVWLMNHRFLKKQAAKLKELIEQGET